MTPECLKAVSESWFFVYPGTVVVIALVCMVIGFLGAMVASKA